MARYDVASLTHPDNLSQQELIQYLSQELNKISAAFRLVDEGRQNVFSVAPLKPRAGQIAYADGVGWNPGSGAGEYVYDGSNWIYLIGTSGRHQYTPTIIGLTTAGVGTYTRQNGLYVTFGPITVAFAEVIWTAHTGTGQMSLVLPVAAAAAGSGGIPNFQIGLVVANGWTWAAGTVDISVLVAQGTTRCDIYQNASGALGAQAVVAAGTIRATLVYVTS